MKSKNFHRLEQLDRIEFLLASDREQRHFSDNIITFRVLNIIFILWFVLFSTGMLFYIGFENPAILNLLFALNFKSVFLWGIFISLVIDGASIYSHRKRSKNLDNVFLKRGGLKN